MKTAFINLGCPKNQVDLEIILGSLSVETAQLQDADAVIINTCAFIESAKRESIDAIFEAVSVKEKHPELKIIVSGCLPQRYRDKIKALIPEVDHFVDTREAELTAEEIRRYLKLPVRPQGRRLLSPSHYAYLRIAEGCDNRCAYCAIPLIKGGYRSRPAAEILAEAHRLAEQGVKELLIIAQDTTNYRDEDGIDLPQLLARLETVPGVQWIRLMYTHPAHWSDRLIEAFGDFEKVVPYADIPIQHISDALLQRMNRKTTRAQIEELIDRLRRRVPNIALRTTLLVGFPGETDRDFEELIDFVETVRFDHLGVFTYSREEGTRAYRIKDDVPEEVKLERQQEIMRRQIEIAEERNAEWIGRTVRVLVDENDAQSGIAYARSSYQAPDIDGNILLPPIVAAGEFRTVKITDFELFDLRGEIID
ncbi:MAG: 30S ribosomal protein S12 methylthiotransferase RimO [candidate division KSB1 bacterium]|nr:30S ribosomal protein S12 methylthiotransferase RimO [candidate division KSB1 bacterium]